MCSTRLVSIEEISLLLLHLRSGGWVPGRVARAGVGLGRERHSGHCDESEIDDYTAAATTRQRTFRASIQRSGRENAFGGGVAGSEEVDSAWTTATRSAIDDCLGASLPFVVELDAVLAPSSRRSRAELIDAHAREYHCETNPRGHCCPSSPTACATCLSSA